MCSSQCWWQCFINTNQDFPLEAAEPVAYLLSEQFNINCATAKTIVFDRHSPVFTWTILSNPIQQVNSFSYWNVYFATNIPGASIPSGYNSKWKTKKCRHSPNAFMVYLGSQLVVFRVPGLGTTPPPCSAKRILSPPHSRFAQDYMSL